MNCEHLQAYCQMLEQARSQTLNVQSLLAFKTASGRDPPHAAVLLASAHLLSHDSQGASFFLVLIGCRPLLVMLETLDQELAQFFLVLVNKKCQGKAEHFCTLLASQHLAFCKPIGGGSGKLSEALCAAQ